MKQGITKSPHFLFILALLIAVPALFINLGRQPVIDDEGIRALVAFEMLEKGDFITPSIAGEIYLKKPPLYNWLIAASFSVLDRHDEFALRLPMVISLLLFTLVIFYYYRKEMDVRFASIAALLFLTSGRILIYESLHGLIDTTYSLVIFIFFMHIYRSFMQGNLLKLFLLGYLLIAISFLMKGLPSLLFLGITLLVLFLSNKKFKLLFHWGHYLGILIFVFIIGGYYLLYFSRNEIAPEDMLRVVIGESARRTAVHSGFWKTLLHLGAYPFNVLYHFLPWGLMALLLFRRGIVQTIKKQPFIRYLSLVFLANIVVYWVSPAVYPRYILMLIPPLFGVFTYLYLMQKKEETVQVRLVEWILGGALGLSVFSGLVPFFIDLPIETRSLYIVSAALVFTLLAINFLFWRQTENRLYWLVLALLVIRIGFDLIVIPARVAESEEVEARNQIRELIEQTGDHSLKFYWNPDFKPDVYYGYRVTSYRTNYYLAHFKNKPIQLVKEIGNDPGVFYISKHSLVNPELIEVIETFRPPGHQSDLVLFRNPL